MKNFLYSVVLFWLGIPSAIQATDGIKIITSNGKEYTYTAEDDIATLHLCSTLKNTQDGVSILADYEDPFPLTCNAACWENIIECLRLQKILIQEDSQEVPYEEQVSYKRAETEQALDAKIAGLDTDSLFALIWGLDYLGSPQELIDSSVNRWFTDHEFLNFEKDSIRYSLPLAVVLTWRKKLEHKLKELFVFDAQKPVECKKVITLPRLDLPPYAFDLKIKRIMCYSPDGSLLAVYLKNFAVLDIIDIASQKCILSSDLPPQQVESIEFSPDGKHIIISRGRRDSIHDTDIYDIEKKVFLHNKSSYALSFSKELDGKNPKGNIVACGKRLPCAKNEIGEVHIKNARTQDVLHVLKGHTKSVGATRFSPDGNFIASVTDDHMVRIWDFMDSVNRLIDRSDFNQLRLLMVWCHKKQHSLAWDLNNNPALLELFKKFNEQDQALLTKMLPLHIVAQRSLLQRLCTSQATPAAIAGIGVLACLAWRYYTT